MARSSYIYTAVTKPSATNPTGTVVVACTVKYEFINRCQQAVDLGHMVPGEFTLYRTPNNGLWGNGANITSQFEFDRTQQ